MLNELEAVATSGADHSSVVLDEREAARSMRPARKARPSSPDSRHSR
jgi:hypothetical protein